jgi:hypothetical protein
MQIQAEKVRELARAVAQSATPGIDYGSCEVKLSDRPLVLYHANCADGFGAAWACWHAFGKEIEAVPVQYGEPPPDVSGRDVLCVDFSYPRDVLLRMKEQARSLRVIDHHKTAKEALAGLDFAVFDDDESGATLTWRTLMPEKEVPLLLCYVRDRDLWTWRLPHSKEVNAWLRCCVPCEFEAWSGAEYDLNRYFPRVCQIGYGALAQVDAYVKDMKRAARKVRLFGEEPYVVNAPEPNISEVLGAIAEEHPPFAVGYFQRSDGRWQYSLRSRGAFDVSEIAKRFGGGGHRNAAGFESAWSIDFLGSVS